MVVAVPHDRGEEPLEPVTSAGRPLPERRNPAGV